MHRDKPIIEKLKEYLFGCDYVEQTVEDDLVGMINCVLGFVDGKPVCAIHVPDGLRMEMKCLKGDCYDYVKEKIEEACKEGGLDIKVLYTPENVIVLEIDPKDKTSGHYY